MKFEKYIDHTLLKPNATKQEIEQLIEEAKTYDFASVCVNPYWVKFASERLTGINVHVCTVIGFPLGASTTANKVAETKDAIANGADEVDMVINVSALIDGDDDVVKEDIAAVVQAANGHIVKVILETCLLNEEQIVRACHLAMEAKADFVKTSTGFSTGGARVADVQLMAKTVHPHLKVKASGQIRDADTAKKMIEAGADRLGTSSGVQIVNNL